MHVARTVAIAIVLTVFAGPASAQDLIVQKSFATQLFEPAMGSRDLMFTVEPGTTAEHLGFGLGLLFNYQHKPLVIFVEEKDGSTIDDAFDLGKATEIVLVESQMTADLVAALGLKFGWLRAQIGLNLPVNLLLRGAEVDQVGKPVTNGDGTPASFSSTNVGDLRMQIKVKLLHDLGGFHLALSPVLTFPTGKSDAFGGEKTLSVKPRVVASYHIGKLVVAANLGYLIREDSTIYSSEVGDQLLWGVGAGFQVHQRVTLLAEVFGRSGFNTASGCTQDGNGNRVCSDTSAFNGHAHPIEGEVGGRFKIASGFNVVAGLGVGLHKGIGVPQVRGVLGLMWAPDFKDTDGDGVFDASDQCPTQAEDEDGYKDDDGCPDLDNDEDLIPDARDKCPAEAEDKDGFEDADGCPDTDNDKDGISDLRDACPFKAETKNGFKDEDGCPDVPDADGDGVGDASDKCPKEAEDKDGFKDDDGCADPDNDEDGVPDGFDDCPKVAEDKDNFEDDDGCPDPDNDKDGVLDANDKCPSKPETINGIKDGDGCPDRGKSKVLIKNNKIIILDKVFFNTGKAQILRKSNPLLTQVALTLVANPQIKFIQIEGHTDSQGNARKNKALSQKRAEQVRTYLIEKGVVATRLFARGFGPERPIADNRTKRGRSSNRRVEFTILEKAPSK